MNENYREQLKLIFNSDVFNRMRAQQHHYNTTLMRHVINVAKVCRSISRVLQRAGIRISEGELLVAAFCHDLGMTDRYNKEIYPTHMDLALGHGRRSIYYARSILKDRFTKKEAHIIERHMFPMKKGPKCIEGWILIIADKFCTVKDFIVNLF